MNTRASRKILELTDEIRDFAVNPTRVEVNFHRATRVINESLSRHSFDPMTLHRLAIGLEALAPFQAAQGASRVLDGDANGWSQLHLSMYYSFWEVRIQVHLYDTMSGQRRFTIGLRDGAITFAHAIVDGAFDESDWLGKQLVASFAGQPFGYSFGTPLEPFMTRLYQIWRGHPADTMVSQGLGVYERIISSWNGDSLQNALFAACDYHLKRTETRSDSDLAEFGSTPYYLFPVEILAVQRVREDLGLSNPTVDHPLMATPLAKPPVQMPEVRDDLLERIINRVGPVLNEQI